MRERKRILIVEDDRWIRELLARLFQDEGFDVAVASNGFTALRLVEQAPPDLTILDLGLPEISGADVLQTLLQDARTCDMPIVVMTGSDDYLNATIAASGVPVIRKPFDSLELRETIQEAIMRNAVKAPALAGSLGA